MNSLWVKGTTVGPGHRERESNGSESLCVFNIVSKEETDRL